MAITTNPKGRFQLTLETPAALAAAVHEQWQIYAYTQLSRLEDDPMVYGHLDSRIIMIRAVQGHSREMVDAALFTRELHAEDTDLPTLCVHGTQGPIDSIIQHGLVPGGLTPGGDAPIRARDMVHFAVSSQDRPRGLSQLAALHRHRTRDIT